MEVYRKGTKWGKEGKKREGKDDWEMWKENGKEKERKRREWIPEVENLEWKESCLSCLSGTLPTPSKQDIISKTGFYSIKYKYKINT